MNKVSIKVSWDHVLIDCGDIVHKTVFPVSADLNISMQPALMSLVESQNGLVVSLSDAAKEYVKLLKSGGTYADFADFCGERYDKYLAKLRSEYSVRSGILLPPLKAAPSAKRLKFNSDDIDGAMSALSFL